MKKLHLFALACLVLAAKPLLAQSVLTYHNASDRSGLYVVPGLSKAAAAGVHLDSRFHAVISGNVFAQPLYWQAPGAKIGHLIVATESNLVYALNPNTGAQIWKTQLAAPAPQAVLNCGDIDPEGITGTPVIDDASGTLYLDATVLTSANTPRHMIYALSLANGKVLPHWPVNVEAAMNARHARFSSFDTGERSALQFFKGKLYVNYAGRAGDCGSYHGTVIEFTPASRSITGSWETRAIGGGIWSQGGVASDGAALFATTGNTFGADIWRDGEAVIRLRPGLARAAGTTDYFTPSNWKALDNSDSDLGGTQALPISVPTASGAVRRIIAMGKDGNAYLINGANLGGIGHPLKVLNVSQSSIITAPAVYNAQSSTSVVFTNGNGSTSGCSGNNLTMLKITSAPTALSVDWCAPFNGRGAPIVTTTPGNANPIVWVTGAEGDNRLHGFDALSGKSLFVSPTGMTGLRHFGTLIAANRHLYVAADGTVFAFAF